MRIIFISQGRSEIIFIKPWPDDSTAVLIVIFAEHLVYASVVWAEKCCETGGVVVR